MTTHVFLPVYLNSNKEILDNSTNAVETLDASFNFLMDTTYCSANYLKQFLKYRKSNDKYYFKFNESYKILSENQIKNDIYYSSIELYDSSFNSGVSPNKANIGRMLVRYICDTLLGHPFAQAFLANEKDIIDTVRNSNLHKQITFSLSKNLSTSEFSSDDICLSLLKQFLDLSPERFSNDQDDTEYNFPFQTGDFITLFIKMNCYINLSKRTTKQSTTTTTNLASWTHTYDYGLKNTYKLNNTYDSSNSPSDITLSNGVTKFLDSGGMFDNYANSIDRYITFDAGADASGNPNNIWIKIINFESEHTAYSMYDRLGIQASNTYSDLGTSSGNLNSVKAPLLSPGLYQSASSSPPWSNSWVSDNSGYGTGGGYIFPNISSSSDSKGNTFSSSLLNTWLEIKSRYVRFYFYSDSATNYDGWEIYLAPRIYNRETTTTTTSQISSDESYNLIKRMFQNKQSISFDDNNNQLNFDEKIWRVKIELL